MLPNIIDLTKKLIFCELKEQGLKKNRIFNENIKQNLMFLDRDGKGERKISFDGSKTYSFFSLKLS